MLPLTFTILPTNMPITISTVTKLPVMTKKRRGQEITFSRRTHNEFVSNYITLKNRDDIYKGEADGYENDPNQYYEPGFNKSDKFEKDWMPENYMDRRKENFGVTRSITFGAYMIPATTSMIRMKASVSATA